MSAPPVPDRYLLTWAEGLCYHGCGQPLARPRNRFINGHDSKLLDVLLDAQKSGDRVWVRAPGEDEYVDFSPRGWAHTAFFDPGYRWFLVKAGLTEPAYDELQGAEDPDVTHLSMGGPTSIAARAESARLPEGLASDLATVREIVGRAAESWADVERIDRLEATIVDLRRQLSEAIRPVVVTGDGVAELSDRDVLSAAYHRARLAAEVLQRARYEGDASELWDLVSMFSSRWVDPVRVRAARAFLGQEDAR